MGATGGARGGQPQEKDDQEEEDPFARARRRKEQRDLASAEERALAATALQSAFRGKKQRDHLVKTRSSHAEYFMHHGSSPPATADPFDGEVLQRARARAARQKEERLEALEGEATQLREMLEYLEVCVRDVIPELPPVEGGGDGSAAEQAAAEGSGPEHSAREKLNLILEAISSLSLLDENHEEGLGAAGMAVFDGIAEEAVPEGDGAAESGVDVEDGGS
jgi:hypothetical protein|eukprot:SAG25_NODE_221_length_11616_cov_56.164018_4_plen_221_part_00